MSGACRATATGPTAAGTRADQARARDAAARGALGLRGGLKSGVYERYGEERPSAYGRGARTQW